MNDQSGYGDAARLPTLRYELPATKRDSRPHRAGKIRAGSRPLPLIWAESGDTGRRELRRREKFAGPTVAQSLPRPAASSLIPQRPAAAPPEDEPEPMTTRRTFHRCLGAALLGAMTLLHAPAARAGALDDIMASGTLKVAVPQDFPPFGSVGPDMAPVGYDIDVATLIAEKLGVKVELVPVTSANRIPYLQTKKVDLVISSLGKNPDREKVIDFTTAYAPFFNGVFGPTTSRWPRSRTWPARPSASRAARSRIWS